MYYQLHDTEDFAYLLQLVHVYAYAATLLLNSVLADGRL